MICQGWKRATVLWAVCGILAISLLAAASSAQAGIIVNDSWTDGGRDDGADPLDINWWTSANANGIEVSVGSMGMVTGGSGRGIHGLFPKKTLTNIGNKLIATYTFTTPGTIGSGAAAFRVGLFDTLDRAGLNANITATSTEPSPHYGWGTAASPAGPGTAGLPGYMLDMDVGTTANDLSFRKHDSGTVNPTGRLLGTNTGFTQLSPTGPDNAFTFTANTTYTGSFSLTRSSATELELTATLGSATHTITNVFDSASYGMIAFWANGGIFGSSSTPNTANNGIDFSNITIEYVPEMSSIGLAVLGAIGTLAARRRRNG